MNEIKRTGTGVMFESDVLCFIDDLAAGQQRSRSFIINQIIRHYARVMQRAETEKPKKNEDLMPAIPF